MNMGVMTLRDDTSVKDVARFLHEKAINGVPIVDDTGKMVGIVSQSDLIKLAKVTAGAELDQEREASNYDGTKASKKPGIFQYILSPLLVIRMQRSVARLDKDMQESEVLEDKTAADIMTKEVISVGLNEPIKKVAELMTAHGINRVPVLGNEGQLSGMITRADLVQALAKQLGAK